MIEKYVSIEELALKSKVDEYPKGANSPTVVTRYACPCGKGEVVDRNTVGFNDRFVTLECRRCRRTYHPFVDIVGCDFCFYEKEQGDGKI